MSSFIEIKNLHFSYVNDLEEPPVKTEVLKGINLNIEKGEFVAVLGHNGSGKSTLAKCINAINLPESGAVYVNGMDTLDENNLLPIREKVGMVFQNPDNQIVFPSPESQHVQPSIHQSGMGNASLPHRLLHAMQAFLPSSYDLLHHLLPSR